MRSRRYFIAVNTHRSTKTDGLAQTWVVNECKDAAQQRRALRWGLPLQGENTIDCSGQLHPYYSTNGVRAATSAEIREAKRLEEQGMPIPKITEDFADILDYGC